MLCEIKLPLSGTLTMSLGSLTELTLPSFDERTALPLTTTECIVLLKSIGMYMCVRVCVCARVRVCARACVCVRARACVCVCDVSVCTHIRTSAHAYILLVCICAYVAFVITHIELLVYSLEQIICMYVLSTVGLHKIINSWCCLKLLLYFV